MRTLKDYDSSKPIWCPGCGNFAVLAGLKRAFANLDIDPKDLVVVSGIGCSSRINGFIKCYGFHGVHGRLLPVATAVKLANPRLTVIGAGGDGDGYALGMSHFIHASRRNVDVTYIVMDNQIYGLTKGQTSPTSPPGFVTATTPFGSKERPVDGVGLALLSGATFVARGFSGNAKRLTEIFIKAIKHKGFSFVDVLSPCVTFNRLNTYDWFRERIHSIEEDNDYDPSSREKAIQKLFTVQGIPVGIFLDERKNTFGEEILKDPTHVAVEENIEERDTRPFEKIAKIFT